ncbi:hypothetical protein [Komarekiella delphini-convector]|uniref:hypothetical protein n=1 Tax=Komarekiella delphini-convector TaxID=3050158 RepID=UPI0032B01C53
MVEGCRRELREALSDWLALRLRLGLTIPVIAGINLQVKFKRRGTRSLAQRGAVLSLSK